MVSLVYVIFLYSKYFTAFEASCAGWQEMIAWQGDIRGRCREGAMLAGGKIVPVVPCLLLISMSPMCRGPRRDSQVAGSQTQAFRHVW